MLSTLKFQGGCQRFGTCSADQYAQDGSETIVHDDVKEWYVVDIILFCRWFFGQMFSSYFSAFLQI